SIQFPAHRQICVHEVTFARTGYAAIDGRALDCTRSAPFDQVAISPPNGDLPGCQGPSSLGPLSSRDHLVEDIGSADRGTSGIAGGNNLHRAAAIVLQGR